MDEREEIIKEATTTTTIEEFESNQFSVESYQSLLYLNINIILYITGTQ